MNIAVGVAITSRYVGHLGDRHRLPTGFDPIQTLIRPFGEPQGSRRDPPRSPAVLVHGGPRVPWWSENINAVANDHRSPGLLGPRLRPPQISSVHPHAAEPSRGTHNELGCDRRWP